MSDIIFKSISGQINIDEAQGIVECFVSGVGNKDSVGDVVLPGAFTASLRRRKPRVVWGHDWNQPIGKVIDIYEVPASDPRLPAKMKQAGIGGLFAKVQFNLKSEKGREAFSNVSFFGEDQEWSIGYKTLDAIYDNERKANLLREVELYEVSPVLHGANQLTGTISIKSELQSQDDATFAFDEIDGTSIYSDDELLDLFAWRDQKSLDRWFEEDWVDISRPKKGGGFEPCGREDAASGKYPKCVPSSKASKMTPEEIASAVRRKRTAESTQTRQDKKPIYVSTDAKDDYDDDFEAKSAIPTDPELYARVKAEAKDKFAVYPSAYANAWLVRTYKKRGGGYKASPKGLYEEAYGKDALRDPKGGLTAAGRAYFNRTEGSNLKPGVMGPADTPEKMRRKGSFLTRFFTSPSGPMKDEDGEPTRLALSAAAWGEPVPQNMEDAAELAAKGRRLLERYQAQKGKGDDVYEELSRIDAEGDDDDADYSGPRGPEGGVPALKPKEGRAGNLALALSMRFGGAVRLRDADGNMVIFDHMSDEGEKNTFRLTYHFDGDEFMFGNLVKVKPETVYLAIEDEEKSLDAMDEALFELAQLGDSYSEKAGRVISTNNMMKLQQAMALMQEVLATGGRENIEMKEKDALFILGDISELFEIKTFLDPVFDHYSVETEVVENGIVVKGNSANLESAISNALTSMNELEAKSLDTVVIHIATKSL